MRSYGEPQGFSRVLLSSSHVIGETAVVRTGVRHGKTMQELSTQNSLTSGSGAESDDDLPTFVPRKGVLLREYYVFVVWASGRRMKVGRFLRRPDAWRWIEQKSAEWLATQRVTEISS
jgi:hypothetical protein